LATPECYPRLWVEGYRIFRNAIERKPIVLPDSCDFSRLLWNAKERFMVPEAGIEPARLSARDFLTTSTFATAQHLAGRSWSGARLHHSLAAAGARRLLSTPSQAVAWTWLGVGSDAEASRAFADFDGLHFERFPPKAQIVQVPCVYRFHHSGVVRNAPKTPTFWPASSSRKDLTEQVLSPLDLRVSHPRAAGRL